MQTLRSVLAVVLFIGAGVLLSQSGVKHANASVPNNHIVQYALAQSELPGSGCSAGQPCFMSTATVSSTSTFADTITSTKGSGAAMILAQPAKICTDSVTCNYGIYSNGTTNLTLWAGGTNVLSIGSSSNVTISGTLGVTGALSVGTTMSFSPAVPTISSGFGTSPSVTGGKAIAFRVNVGTGGSATSGVVGLATAANGWNCNCTDITTHSATVFSCKQTAGTVSTATIGNFDAAGVAAAWVASDILAVNCTAF